MSTWNKLPSVSPIISNHSNGGNHQIENSLKVILIYFILFLFFEQTLWREKRKRKRGDYFES